MKGKTAAHKAAVFFLCYSSADLPATPFIKVKDSARLNVSLAQGDKKGWKRLLPSFFVFIRNSPDYLSRMMVSVPW